MATLSRVGEGKAPSAELINQMCDRIEALEGGKKTAPAKKPVKKIGKKK